MKTSRIHSESGPSEMEIQHAAYLLWVENGRPEGRDLDHWLAARELLSHRHGRNAQPPRRTRAAAASKQS